MPPAARAVGIWVGGRDTHSRNFTSLKENLLPPLDQCFGALIAGLDQQGLLDSTLAVQSGEFGRTPKVNINAGRDHWPEAFRVALAGGGLKRAIRPAIARQPVVNVSLDGRRVYGK